MHLPRPPLLILLLLLCGPATGAEISVAVASNFAGTMRELAGAFERQTGHHVTLAFGSSGKIYAQVRHGAPFQLFFSADQAKPAALEEAGLAVPGSRITYAVGALALWSPDPSRVDPQGQVLQSGDFDRLAIANPRLAPYGAAALEAIQALGLEHQLRDKLVQGENIAQAYQFVATGNSELGLVALSQILEDGRLKAGSAWIVPERLHSPIRQDAVLLTRGEKVPAARQLLQFMGSDEARKIIHSHGYRTEPIG